MITAIPTEEIRRQPDPDKGCAYYAIQNLYLACGLNPPPVEMLSTAANENYTTAPDHLGLTAQQQFAFLGMLEFPFPMAYTMIPRQMEAHGLFPVLMDEGCILMFNFFFTMDGERHGHSVVAESYSDDGITAICSGPYSGDGMRIKWEFTSADRMIDDGGSHGRRVIIPWRTQGYDEWFGMNPHNIPLGIGRDFVTVIPVGQHPGPGGWK